MEVDTDIPADGTNFQDTPAAPVMAIVESEVFALAEIFAFLKLSDALIASAIA